MERCLKKLVLEAETTGFQDPARTARNLQREELCWKGSVGGQWVYTHECRRAKKLIPVQSEQYLSHQIVDRLIPFGRCRKNLLLGLHAL